MPRINPSLFLEMPFFDHQTYWVDYDPNNYMPREAGIHLNQQWYDARMHRGAFGGKLNNQVFMLKRLHFDADPAEDDEWGPVRILGAGSYGHAGHWQKRDPRNVPIDELALKESVLENNKPPRTAAEIPSKYNKPRVLKEATIQNDLNWKEERAAPHLRRYKFISDHRAAEAGRYRSFLEFCPHNSLDHLRCLYRAWDHYLPEVFVWHVFHYLAISCEAFRQPPPPDALAVDEDEFEDYEADAEAGLFCLHLDMKPQNVLLGYEPDDPSQHPDFPEPKMADYGMSEYSGPGDLRNPTSFWWRGTKVYLGTEQTFYGAQWQIPPNGAQVRTHDTRGRRLDYKRAKVDQHLYNYQNSDGDVVFDHSLNIYGAGVTMYALATLSKDQRLARIRAKQYNKYRQNGNHQISKVTTKVPGVYSSRLRHLIHRCIDPDPANRPSQVELIDATLRGLRLAERRAKRARREAHAAAAGDPNVEPPKLPSEKVYYRDHEINDLPLGNAGFKPREDDFKYLVREEFTNPDIPRLKLPAAKYGHYPPSWHKPTGNWRTLYSNTNRDNLWFKPVH